jgi:hypothetical protein
MTTAPKSPSKRGKAGKTSTPALLTPQREETYAMPLSVKDWIERANSTIQHLRGEIERLKTENMELKSYKTWAEHRILRSEHER